MVIPVVKMVNFSVRVDRGVASSSARIPITAAAQASPLQALQISLQPGDSRVPCSNDAFTRLWQVPFGNWHQGDRRGVSGRGVVHRREGSPGQEDLRGVCCIDGLISPLRYYLTDKIGLRNSRGSISPLFSTLPGETLGV